MRSLLWPWNVMHAPLLPSKQNFLIFKFNIESAGVSKCVSRYGSISQEV